MGGTYEIHGGGAMKLMGGGYEIDRGGGLCIGWGGGGYEIDSGADEIDGGAMKWMGAGL